MIHLSRLCFVTGRKFPCGSTKLHGCDHVCTHLQNSLSADDATTNLQGRRWV